MKQILLLISILWWNIGFSQTLSPDVWATSGDYYSNANNSLSWTIGECITETYSNANNSLTQGFQQSKYNITSVEENTKSDFSVAVYPNPASKYINIAIESTNQPIGNSAKGGARKMNLELVDIA